MTKKPKQKGIPMKEFLEEMALRKKRGKPRCMICKTDYKKLDEYSWDLSCKCKGSEKSKYRLAIL